MADISSLSGPSLVDYLTEKNNSSYFETSYTAASANKMLTDAFKAQSGYGSGVSASAALEALQRALSEMDIASGKVTLADVEAYQKELEAEFSESLRKAVEEMGIDPEVKYSLNISAEGKITVNSGDPIAKEKIENYLAENPGVGEQFSYIQALANLDRATQSPAATAPAWKDMVSARKAIQADAVQAFFSAALNSGMSYNSMLASFSPEAQTAQYFTGVNYLI